MSSDLEEAMPSLGKAPRTVVEYAETIERTGGGQFTSQLQEETRWGLASLFGAPFFAISQFAPELLEKSNARILFAGEVELLGVDGGRWLSLYARALNAAGRLSSTVCVGSSQRPFKKSPKQLLFQPAQQVLLKDGIKHLPSTASSVDLLIFYCPKIFGANMAALEEIARCLHGRRVLFALDSRPEALLLRQLLKLRGFDVSEILAYEKKLGEPQSLAVGACWVAATSLSVGPPVGLTSDSLASLWDAYRSYQTAIESAIDLAGASGVSNLYATRNALQVQSEDVPNALMFSPGEGVDLISGRWFRRELVSSECHSPSVWTGRKFDEDLLGLAPADQASLSDDENLLHRLTWLGRATAEQARRDEAHTAATTPGPVGLAAPLSNDVVSDEFQRDPNSADSTTIGRAQSSLPSMDVTSPIPQPILSRLSRSAGTIDVAAFAARLGSSRPSGSEFESTRGHILNWLGSKGFSDLSQTESCHIELPNGEIQVETDGRTIWSMRLDDRRGMENGAFWRVEVTLLQVAGELPAIALRLFQIRQHKDAPSPISSLPSVIPAIANHIGLQDSGIPLHCDAVHVREAREVSKLLKLLLNPNRSQSVVIVSSKTLHHVDRSVSRLAKRLTGMAHLLFIEPTVAEAMIQHVGRERSVFGNAIRLYRPGFSVDSDPFQHRLWTYAGGQLPTRLADDVAEEVCAISLEGGDVDERAPSFIDVRAMLSEGRLKALHEQAKHIATTAEEERHRQEAIRREIETSLRESRDQCAELERRLREIKSELLTTRQERDIALDEGRRARNQLENRWSDGVPQTREIGDQSYYPDTWDELEDWVEIYGEGRLVLLPQVAKVARESAFKDIAFAYQTMEFLIQYYVPMRNRAPDEVGIKQAYEKALTQLGVDLSPVGSAVDDRRYKQEYRRQFEGREIKLDLHVKRGVGFDPAVVFRLYFHFDEAHSRVVVGHMPTHLTNRISHSG